MQVPVMALFRDIELSLPWYVMMISFLCDAEHRTTLLFRPHAAAPLMLAAPRN